MPEGRPALQRQGSRKKREGGLQAPLLLFRFVCLFLSPSLLNHYWPKIHGKYYWVHSYQAKCIKKTLLFFPGDDTKFGIE